jgi:hypothetical protein
VPSYLFLVITSAAAIVAALSAGGFIVFDVFQLFTKSTSKDYFFTSVFSTSTSVWKARLPMNISGLRELSKRRERLDLKTKHRQSGRSHQRVKLEDSPPVIVRFLEGTGWHQKIKSYRYQFSVH